ncbi:MAG: sensor domain-containing diguanylate cyclase, partial [Candidatus Heimdallarchaeota archaeon]|nr:sensor domain-containing diguanylate cyclase [Candidatus Heimdallarchaeota archaeon]
SSVYAKSDASGNAIKVFGIVKDITDLETQRRLAESSTKAFELIFNSSPAGIFILDTDFEISMENDTFRDFFQIESGEMKLRNLLGENYDQAVTDLEEGKDVQHLRIKLLIDGKYKHYMVNIAKISEEFLNDYEGTLVDITQQVVDEERILYLATHDVLTTLYNRNYFEEVVVEKENDYPLGLVLCDIDGLKLINDAFGHQRGDELLQSLANSLKGLSPNHIASRIGGDEFALLVDNANEEILEKIELEVKESIKDLGLFGIDFEVSLGHAIMDEDSPDFNRVFNNAENMMYRRKLTERSSRKSNALTTIMQTLHEKTEETLSHCERVGDYSSMLLFESGFKRTVDIEDIRFLSDVHDIG